MVAIAPDDLTAAECLDYLRYDAETGRLIWTKRAARCVIVGTEAGGLHADGYRYVQFRKRLRLVHRLIWLIYYGEWPTTLIDHINRIRDDNRIANLRLGSYVLNSRNTSSRRGSSSQFVGVCWNTKSQAWQAQVGQGGHRLEYLGLFPTEEAAALAYRNAAALRDAAN